MAHRDFISLIDKMIERLEDRKRNAEKWIEKLSSIKSDLGELSDASIEVLNQVLNEEVDEESQGTHFDRISNFFLLIGNSPTSIAEVEQGTGIPRASISTVLYRTHRDRFTSVRSQAGVNLWKLTESEPAMPTFDDKQPPDDSIPF